MDKSLVTVIVPCFNYGHLICETLESIINQTYTLWECIVVDDGSTDNTADTVKYFLESDVRFIYVYQTNKGLSAARNKGLSSAKGEFIQYLDADDIICPTKLESQIRFLESNSLIDLVYGRSYFFEGDFSLNAVYPWVESGSRLHLIKPGELTNVLYYLLIQNIMPVNAALIRRKSIEAVGKFDESLYSCEDWDMWLRLAVNNAKFAFDDREETSCYVRKHQNSMITVNWKMSFYEIKFRLKHHRSLNLNQKKINKSKIKDARKTSLYGLKFINDKDKQERTLLELNQMLSDKRIHLLIYLNRVAPNLFPRWVWLLFESPMNVIRATWLK